MAYGTLHPRFSEIKANYERRRRFDDWICVECRRQVEFHPPAKLRSFVEEK